MRIILNIVFGVMFRKPLKALSLVVLAAVAFTGCSGTTGSSGGADPGSSGGAQVVASTAIWADVISATTCRNLKVVPLIPAGVDAHEFEPTVQDADRLLDADLVFVNGLGLEHSVNDTLTAATQSGVDVVSLAPKMDPIGDDPHVWMDPDRVAAAVPAIYDHLSKLKSLGMNPAELKSCAEGYTSELHRLGESMDAELAAVPESKRKIVTNHENLAYLGDRFGLKIIGTLIPSTSSLGESDPRSLDELAATMKSEGVTSMFVDAVGTRRLADSLAERVGGEVKVQALYVESLGPAGGGADTYLSMMAANATRIVASLSR